MISPEYRNIDQTLKFRVCVPPSATSADFGTVEQSHGRRRMSSVLVFFCRLTGENQTKFVMFEGTRAHNRSPIVRKNGLREYIDNL